MNLAEKHSSPAVPPRRVDGLLRGVRVLVVDDNEDARQLLAFVLENVGAEVTEVESVPLALSALQAQPFDLLISDIGMPDQDGYELIRCLRQAASAEWRSLPAIAVTAFSSVADRARILAAGFEAHLSKPFNIQALLELVAELARRD